MGSSLSQEHRHDDRGVGHGYLTLRHLHEEILLE
jgi:hypothetical protein